MFHYHFRPIFFPYIGNKKNIIYSYHLYNQLCSQNESMKTKLKILQLVQENFAVLGFSSVQSKQIFENSWKILLTNLIFVAYITSICVFLFRVAENFKEYTQTMFMLISAINGYLTYLFFIWKIKNWFESIVFLEKIVNKSSYTITLHTSLKLNSKYETKANK